MSRKNKIHRPVLAGLLLLGCAHPTFHGLSKEEAKILGECHDLQKSWIKLPYAECLRRGGVFKKSF